MNKLSFSFISKFVLRRCDDPFKISDGSAASFEAVCTNDGAYDSDSDQCVEGQQCVIAQLPIKDLGNSLLLQPDTSQIQEGKVDAGVMVK